MMQIRQRILGELDTNCYIISDPASHKALVIDPADNAEEIFVALKEDALAVVGVVLTHAHFDHMLAAEAVCRATGAPLYVGVGDADAMTDPIRNLSGLFTPDKPITIADFNPIRAGDRIAVGTLSFVVMETPGHTPGCICLFGNGTLFAGDTLFAGSIGRLDFPGGDPAAMRTSLLHLMQLPPETKVFSGHGPATTIGHEAAYNPYLR